MIANLLEPHQERQDQTLALDTLSVIEQLRQFFDRLLIERHLFPGKLAERLDLGLVRQIGNHRFVGLQPSQYVRSYQFAQRPVGVVRPVRQMFCETGKFLCRPEQTRVDEIENGPQISQAVFDRRAGKRESRLCLELLGSVSLLRVRILDGLRFVEHDQLP